MALLRKRHPRDPGMSPFKAGLIAIVLIAIGTYFGFSKANPFASPFKLKAIVRTANNLTPNSPVRIAGVNVGKVDSVKGLPGGPGQAEITMEISKQGLPIHRDATLKIRERIFLEGNEFVDLQPGSPESPKVKSGYTLPVQQTATPVQFDQILTALQSNTRKDLQVFLKDYSRGLADGGAQGWNQAVRAMPDAYRYNSLSNEATLGERPHDLSTLERGQAEVFRALDLHDSELRDLVTQFNTTMAAFAREQAPLEQAIPALDRTLRVGVPALVQLNAALPTLRSFAHAALPATRSSGPTIDASMPFITQARGLVSKPELRGLTHDLTVTIPPLAKLNHDSIPLLEQTRELSSCQNQVLLPFATTPIPDPEMEGRSATGNNWNKDSQSPGNPPWPFYKQSARALVGLSGESRINDSNSDMFHVEVGAGPFTIAQTDGAGQQIFGQSAFPIEATRPAKPDHRPVDRPNVPCETQQPPDLHAPLQLASSNQIDQSSQTPIVPSSQMPPDIRKLHDNAALLIARAKSSYDRMQAGKPFVDPLTHPDFNVQEKLARQLGLTWQGGNLVDLRTGK